VKDALVRDVSRFSDEGVLEPVLLRFAFHFWACSRQPKASQTIPSAVAPTATAKATFQNADEVS
jgi:hypothetical protein